MKKCKCIKSYFPNTKTPIFSEGEIYDYKIRTNDICVYDGELKFSFFHKPFHRYFIDLIQLIVRQQRMQ